MPFKFLKCLVNGRSGQMIGVNDIVTNGIREIEAFLRRCIEVGQVRGQIPQVLSADATAKSLLASPVAIRVLGRGVFDEDALRTIADQATRMINL